MKRVLTITLLLFTTTIIAEWRWVEIPTNSPPILNLQEDGTLSSFRMEYDPITQSVMVNLLTQNKQYQTWRFDGTTWYYITECLSGYTTAGDMVFLQQNETMYDFISTYSMPYGNRMTRIGKWDGEAWEILTPMTGQILDATYDVAHQEIVFMTFEDNGYSYLVFYDGVKPEYYQLPSEIYWPLKIEYDLLNDLHLVIVPGGNMGLTWEYKNRTIQNINVPFPYSSTCSGPLLSISYFPPLEGILTFTKGGCTLVWKNHSWTILMKMSDDRTISTSYEAQIVYFPPTEDSLLFLADKNTLEMIVYRFRERSHTRPFQK